MTTRTHPSLARVLWWDQLPTELLEPLGERLIGDHDADVAIVGAGFTGLWTAYYLLAENPGIRIAILEKEIAGFGASGRNGGWASSLFPQTDTAIARTYGVDAAITMRTAMNASVDEIGQVANAHGWDIGWAKGGSLIAARTHAQWQAMYATDREERDRGLTPNSQLLDRDAFGERMHATNIFGGTFTEHCSAIQPARLVRSLARHVVTEGAQLFENSPATSLEPGVVRSTKGAVRARYVIRATEGYTPELAGHHRTLLPVYSLMVATEPLPPETWAEIGLEGRPTFSDGRHVIIYGQRTADDRLAFGGRGAPYRFGSRISQSSEVNQRIHAGLRDTLTEMFPVLRGHTFTHAWGGALGIARDWWASVGLDPRTGLGWSGGYVGDGVTTANLGGRTLAALIAGRSTDPITSLPWVSHRSRSWEIEPARWLATSAAMYAMTSADAVEARTGMPSRRARVMGSLIGH